MPRSSSDRSTAATRRVTLRDVAAEASVSLSTASRVARGAANVRPAVRRRVLDAIDALGYQPDTAARSIRTGRSSVIGYVVADIANPFFAAVVKGAAATFEAGGYALLLASSGNDARTEELALRSLRARRADGLVLSVADEDAPYLGSYVRRIPSVLIDRELPGLPADVVRSDHASGIGDAVGHLARLGHRRLALLTGSGRQLAARARSEAFRAASAACGLPADAVRIATADTGAAQSRALIAEILDVAEPPTGVIVASYELLVALLEGVRARGLDIPGDISIVACDDLDVCRVTTPPLDVVGRDLELLGREAASVLLTRLRGSAAAATTVLPTTFQPRGSSAVPRR
jgi:LacI family transcriptional regulator